MRVLHVLRKPLSEGTVAANTLKHGTGGIHINASRVAGVVPATTQGQSSRQGEVYGKDQRDQRTFVPNAGGRWPANVILQHLDGCRCEGTKKVKSDMGFPAQRGRGSTISGPTGHKGQDRLKSRRLQSEEVANWICETGCPVARLDSDSLAGGMHSAGSSRSAKREAGKTGMFPMDGDGHRFGDKGGASRFYKQVGGEK